MKAIKFKFGTGEIALTKSPKYVGIKSNQLLEKKMNAKIVQEHTLEDELGGFKVLEIKSKTEKCNIDEELEKLRKENEVEVGTHVFHAEDDGIPIVPTGELYVVFHEGADNEECQKLIERYHLMILQARGEKELVLKVTQESPNPIKVAMFLQQSEFVKTAEPDLASTSKQLSINLPEDDLLKYQWHLDNRGKHPDTGTTYGYKKGADANVLNAWNILGSFGSPNVTIAILDDGFDVNHPDFTGKVVHPWDFYRNSSKLDMTADDMHGTQCAGVALASANGRGAVGVAPNARLMPLRQYGLSDAIIERIFDYIIDRGASIVSVSLGLPFMSTRMVNAIRKCTQKGRNGKGCIVCFAAGNSGKRLKGFATHPDAIVVGAATSMDKRASYSNFGENLFVLAPSSGSGGWPITTTDVGRYKGYDNVEREGGVQGLYRRDFGGTSSATPLVAGVVALMLSANPELTATQVKDIIKSTAIKIKPEEHDAKGHSILYGYGRIDAQKAVQKALELGGSTIEVTPVIDLWGMARGKLSGKGAEKIYKFTIGNKLIIQLEGPESSSTDFDLYVKKGDIPDPMSRNFDYSSAEYASKEKIIIEEAEAGTYYVLVKSYTGKGDFKLKVGRE